MRHLIASTLAISALLGTSIAAAQPLGEQGDLVLNFERMFGMHWWSSHVDPDGPGPDQDADGMVIGLGWQRHAGTYNAPRMGFDGFIIDQLSLGGSLGFYSLSGDADGSGIILYPRVGYAIPLSDSWAFWPRGGISYSDVDESPTGDATRWALSGEGQFLWFPQPSWAVMFGPTLDIGLSGSVGNADFRDHNFGIQVGGIGMF